MQISGTAFLHTTHSHPLSFGNSSSPIKIGGMAVNVIESFGRDFHRHTLSDNKQSLTTRCIDMEKKPTVQELIDNMIPPDNCPFPPNPPIHPIPPIIISSSSSHKTTSNEFMQPKSCITLIEHLVTEIHLILPETPPDPNMA